MNWNILEGLRYTRQHEWARHEEGENTVTAGITDYAQDKLGKIVFVELPQAGDTLSAGDSMAVIESVKAVADVYAPVSGTITSVNEELEEKPELLNEDPYQEGWIIKIEMENSAELEGLMSKEEYEKHVWQEEEEEEEGEESE